MSSKRKRQSLEQETAPLKQKGDKVKEDASAPKPSISAAATSAVKNKVRTFQEDWLRDWLRYDNHKKLMTCFFEWKSHIFPEKQTATGCSKFKRETMTKHASSGQHHRCHDVCLDHTWPLLRALDTQRVKESECTQDDLVVKFNTAYTIVKEEMAFTKFLPLLALQKKNGIEVSYAYANDVKCAQFDGSITDCLKNEMAEHVVKRRYLAVMFDSTTDCSVQETEAVIVQYVRNGHPVNELLALASLKQTHADGIIDAITTSFASIGHKTFKDDGASANHVPREASRQSCQMSAVAFGVSCHGNAEDIRHVRECHPCARLAAQDVPQQL